jgi:MerR family mercuric resistance operon transcriptional regulator
MKPITIGELARKFGIKSGTIRYYERIGLLHKPDINISGYRQYSEDYVKIVKFIIHAKKLGFSLKEISELLSIRVDEKNSCARIKKIIGFKIDDVDRKLKYLKELRTALLKLRELCDKNLGGNHCPIVDILDEYE